MSRNWLIALLFIIIGGLAAFEYWSGTLYPEISFEPGTLQPLAIGVERTYDYYKEDVRVGSYMFRVESRGLYAGEMAYFTSSRTSVTYEEKSIEIETVYVFGEGLEPLEYRLNASLGDEEQQITCLFDNWSVDATLVWADGRVEEPLELPEDSVLIDHFMLGHWELLFNAFRPVPGRRFTVNAYMPQMLQYRPLEIYAEKKMSTVEIGGVEYDCSVLRAPELNLFFYIHEGEIIKLEDTEQFIVISMTG